MHWAGDRLPPADPAALGHLSGPLLYPPKTKIIYCSM